MEKDECVKELRELVRLLARNIGVLDKSEASCCGTTIGQCHAVTEIGRAHGLTLNELADIIKLDNSTISRTINNLVEQELVTREADPEDRRYIKLKLTDKGMSVYETIESSMEVYYKAILNNIPEEKHGQLIESLTLLVNAISSNKCC